ncbi:MAG: response regulator [Proteobacteria bacterium]|nr:response regulator [Pseudomonadota bacterium]
MGQNKLFPEFSADDNSSFLWIIAILLGTIFFSELIIMYFMAPFEKGYTRWAIAFFDAIILFCIVAPVLYLTLLKPMRRRLELLTKTDKILQNLANLQERKITQGNAQLITEIDERKQIEVTLKNNFQTQSIINKLLLLSLNDMPLKDLLQEFICHVTSLPWLSLEPKGAVLLSEGENNLKLYAQSGLSQEIITRCGNVPFGVCLCGKSAQTGQVVFADHIDHRHDITFEGMKPHGHYCVPIISSRKKLLGVFTLYTVAGHPRAPIIEETLISIAGVAANILEHKMAQEERENLRGQLRQSQKLEAIGTLAGGIAHDFNNILAAIIGYSEMAQAELPEGSISRSDINQVLIAGKRAKELVEHILLFSRSGNQAPAPMRITPIVKEVLKLLRATIPSSIEIKQSLSSDIGATLIDPTQLHQIIMNLCTNATHAMEQGGILAVQLSSATLNADDIKSLAPELTPGKYIQLTVTDTGKGMDEPTLKRIFEPYFTTKDPDKGTGLGLSVVHGIIASCGGAITVESLPGKGSTFRVYFPEIGEKTIGEGISLAPAPFPSGRERILVVDDEQPITDLEKRILEQLGYTITNINSSMGALKLFKSDPDGFDLIITDQTMPHLTGADLAREILQIRPDIPIILCTGYSESLTEEKAEQLGIKKYLRKPVVARELAETVRKVLDA